MKFEAILFDCDGVLVDSEPIVNGVLRDMLEEAGWAMTLADCMATFVGKAVRDERALIAARTGRPLTDDWLSAFYERRNLALREGLAAIDGALVAHRLANKGGHAFRQRHRPAGLLEHVAQQAVDDGLAVHQHAVAI